MGVWLNQRFSGQRWVELSAVKDSAELIWVLSVIWWLIDNDRKGSGYPGNESSESTYLHYTYTCTYMYNLKKGAVVKSLYKLLYNLE